MITCQKLFYMVGSISEAIEKAESIKAEVGADIKDYEHF